MRWLKPFLLIVTVAVSAGLSCWGLARTWGLPFVLDESQVYAQVQLFLEGRPELLKWPGQAYPAAAMLPGFQAVLAVVAAATGGDSPSMLRLYCCAFSWLYALVVYKLSRLFVTTETAVLRSAQAYLLPIAFPFHFLMYTDIFSLLVILSAFWAAVRDYRHLAGLLMIFSLAVRQTNVVFVAFLWAFMYAETYGFRFEVHQLIAHARRWWLLGAALLVFGAFLAVHGRVGLDDPTQQPMTISVGNLAISLALAGLLLLPMHVANVPEILRMARHRWRVTVLIAGLVLITALLYSPSHRWNELEGLLRNELLERLTGSAAGRLLFAITMAGTALSIAVTPLVRPGAVLIYPYWLLQLAPVLLVEPRYYLSSYVLFLLMRRQSSVWTELAIWVWFVLLSLWLHCGITSLHFML